MFVLQACQNSYIIIYYSNKIRWNSLFNLPDIPHLHNKYVPQSIIFDFCDQSWCNFRLLGLGNYLTLVQVINLSLQDSSFLAVISLTQIFLCSERRTNVFAILCQRYQLLRQAINSTKHDLILSHVILDIYLVSLLLLNCKNNS